MFQYDIEKGLLLKLDSFLQIQLGTVYRGLTPVPDDEVLKIYRNRIIPVKYVEGDRHNVRSKQLLFSPKSSNLMHIWFRVKMVVKWFN